ncbi:hypothetical protein OK006_6535 [Actinobacteria bacterium OK006]|nr:hypothetical protein OK006_6535 [Actinobacteria bacterium OK006]
MSTSLRSACATRPPPTANVVRRGVSVAACLLVSGFVPLPTGEHRDLAVGLSSAAHGTARTDEHPVDSRLLAGRLLTASQTSSPTCSTASAGRGAGAEWAFHCWATELLGAARARVRLPGILQKVAAFTPGMNASQHCYDVQPQNGCFCWTSGQEARQWCASVGTTTVRDWRLVSASPSAQSPRTRSPSSLYSRTARPICRAPGVRRTPTMCRKAPSLVLRRPQARGRR